MGNRSLGNSTGYNATLGSGGCPNGKSKKDKSKAIAYMKKEILKAHLSKTKEEDIETLKKLAIQYDLPLSMFDCRK